MICVKCFSGKVLHCVAANTLHLCIQNTRILYIFRQQNWQEQHLINVRGSNDNGLFISNEHRHDSLVLATLYVHIGQQICKSNADNESIPRLGWTAPTNNSINQQSASINKLHGYNAYYRTIAHTHAYYSYIICCTHDDSIRSSVQHLSERIGYHVIDTHRPILASVCVWFRVVFGNSILIFFFIHQIKLIVCAKLHYRREYKQSQFLWRTTSGYWML